MSAEKPEQNAANSSAGPWSSGQMNAAPQDSLMPAKGADAHERQAERRPANTEMSGASPTPAGAAPEAATDAGDLNGTCGHGVMRRYYACQQCGDAPDGGDVVCWMIVHNGTQITAWTTNKPTDTYSDGFEVIPLGKAATIAALRADLAYYQAKWEHELSTVGKIEHERDALRREVDELRLSLHKVIEQRDRWDAACQQEKADADDAREEVNRLTNNQRLQDSATAAILERAEAAERELAACRDDAELFRFVFSKPRKIDGVFDATFDEKTQQPSASFRSIDLTPIGREWDSDSDSLNRLRAAIIAAKQREKDAQIAEGKLELYENRMTLWDEACTDIAKAIRGQE